MKRKWLGARITAPLPRHVLDADRRARGRSAGVGSEVSDAHELVDPVRLARARALVEPVEVLRRARVLVDLGFIGMRDRVIGSRCLPPRGGHGYAALGGPAARALERPAPAGQQRLALVLAHRAARSARASRHIVARPASTRPAARRRRRPGRRRRARSSRRSPGTTTGTPSTSAWNCISQRVGDGAAVGLAARASALAAGGLHARAPRRPSGRRSPPAPPAPGGRGRCRG